MSDVVITVRGESEKRVAPERGTVHLSVRADGPERGRVVERVAQWSAPLRAQLEQRVVDGAVDEWSSQRVSVWSQRPWTSDGQRLALAHYASVDYDATFSDFAALSWWVAQVSEHDGVHVNHIDWSLTPATHRRIEADAATEAVGVALSRARAYASALGLDTVAPLQIADSGLLTQAEARTQPAMEVMRTAAFSADSAPTSLDLQPANIVVTSSVEARFAAR